MGSYEIDTPNGASVNLSPRQVAQELADRRHCKPIELQPFFSLVDTKHCGDLDLAAGFQVADGPLPLPVPATSGFDFDGNDDVALGWRSLADLNDKVDLRSCARLIIANKSAFSVGLVKDPLSAIVRVRRSSNRGLRPEWPEPFEPRRCRSNRLAERCRSST